MKISIRLIYLLIAFSLTGAIYRITGFITKADWFILKTPIDCLIPFNPIGIWLYLLFYIYIPYSFFKVKESQIKTICFSFIVCALVGGLIFIIFPSTILYPTFQIAGYSSKMLNFVIQNDTSQNCFPSLHGALITICTLAMWDKVKPIRNYISLILMFGMYFSIIQVRRHLFIDLSAGIFLGIFTYLILNYFFNRSKYIND